MTTTITLTEEVAALRELKTSYSAAAAEAKELKAEFERAEATLFARMEAERVGSIKVDDVNFVRAETVYGTVQDRSEFVKWAEAEQPELLETKERKALVNELVRARIDDGQELPPGLGFYTDQYISQRAG